MTQPVTQSVLIVDDEVSMREMLVDLLESSGFVATAVATGDAMLAEFGQSRYDLILLDLRLKGEDGLTLARALRQQSNVPIMILTGKGDETDRILGLELAADDFLMKPFNPRELLARIRALLRRSMQLNVAMESVPAASHDCYYFAGWTVDMTARELKDAQQRTCSLTPGEFLLLETFLSHPHRVLSRDQLLELTRGGDTEVFDRTVDVLIVRLRRKIEPNPKQPTLIRTERGLGYIFTPDIKRSVPV